MDDTLQKVADEFDNEFVSDLACKSQVNLVEDGPSTSSQEQPTTVTKASSSHSLLVNPKQKGNPLLKAIRNVPWEFEDMVPDYQMGRTSCALFLSLRYHNLNPDYIHNRLKLLGKMFHLRVLLIQVLYF